MSTFNDTVKKLTKLLVIQLSITDSKTVTNYKQKREIRQAVQNLIQNIQILITAGPSMAAV